MRHAGRVNLPVASDICTAQHVLECQGCYPTLCEERSGVGAFHLGASHLGTLSPGNPFTGGGVDFSPGHLLTWVHFCLALNLNSPVPVGTVLSF